MPIHSVHQKELLAQIGWVRSLAIQLVRDPDIADDLTQDAMLVALTSSVEKPASVRGWFASILRNLSRTQGRSERRRSEREDLLRVPDRLPSTLQVVERAGAYQEIVAELMQLAEPYRSTLLYRFFDGLSLREIAERMSLTESTVSTRTQEGLRRLRLRLKPNDESEGLAWLSGLASLWPDSLRVPKTAPSLPSFAGVIALSLPIKWALVAIGIVVVVLGIGSLDAPELMDDEPSSAQAGIELVGLQVPEENPSRRTEVKQEGPAVTPPSVDPHAGIHELVASYQRELKEIRGRVIDVQGAPVPGVKVDYTSNDWQAMRLTSASPGVAKRQVTTDYAGVFSLTDRAPLDLHVETELLTTVYSGVVNWDAPTPDPLVIVAPRTKVAGLVVDETGQSVPNAMLSIVFDPVERLPDGLVLEGSRLVEKKTKSDEQGTFEFASAAELGGAKLTANALGFAQASIPVLSGGGLDVRVVMTRLTANAHTIFGQVQLPGGAPSADTMVSAGSVSTRTDASGRFALDFGMALGWMDHKAPLRLAAARAGFLPAIEELISIDEAKSLGWPDDLVLVLGGPPLSIHGRVVDQNGNPILGVLVGSRDMTRFGLEMEPGATWGLPRTLEEVSGGTDWTKSGFNGEFKFKGLLDREYRLRLIETESALTMESSPIRAGDRDVTLVLDRRKLGTLAGQVTDRFGTGMPHIRVAVTRQDTGSLEIGRSTTTDSEGWFRLEGVTVEPELLRIQGVGIVSELFREFPEGAEILRLVLPVSRLIPFQVEWGGWADRACELLLVDSGGDRTEIIDRNGGGFATLLRPSAGERLSRTYSISDSVTHAVLMLSGQEVERFEVYPAPGETTVLRLP